MNWARDLPGWPHSEASRQVAARPHLWHVQVCGHGPDILLIHGAGGASHSFRALMPILAQSYRVIAVDLPGQGFSRLGTKRRCGLGPMSEDLATLVLQEGWDLAAIIGHSAGAAIAPELAQRHLSPRGQAPRVIGINPALGHFDGIAGWLFPMLAKLLALNPLTPWLFSLGTNPTDRARRLIEGTGSRLDPEGLRLYAALISDRAHVDATLQMMAQWSLDGLLAQLQTFAAPTLFLVGEDDRAVRPTVAEAAAAQMPDARVQRFAGAGHLLHEESPNAVAEAILDFLQ